MAISSTDAAAKGAAAESIDKTVLADASPAGLASSGRQTHRGNRVGRRSGLGNGRRVSNGLADDRPVVGG